jgi:hypothetical protein
MLMLVGLLAAVVAPQDQATTTQLTDDTEHGAFVITVGPLDLPPMGSEEHMTMDMPGMFPPIGTVRVPHDAYLYGFDYEIVDSAGSRLSNRLLHHLNVIDATHRELFLPISQRMLAVGRETGAKSMPWLLLGYPVSAGQEMLVTAMMHNESDVSYHRAKLHLVLKYVPARRPWPLFKVYPFQLDVAFPAGDKAFDVPPGHSSRSYEGRPSMAGRIMVIGAHLHPYATSIRFEDVTTNRLVWEGTPIEDAQAELEGVTLGRLYRTLGVKIYPDHTYRVTVTYNNTTGATLPDGGMGVVGGVFMPSGGGPWPLADRNDPLYRLDREHYEREVHGTYAELMAGARGQANPDSGMAGMKGMPGMKHPR